jgi:hypothetical protein
LVHVPEEVKVWTLMPYAVGAVLAHADPVLVNILPVVPGATATAATPPTVNAPVNVEVPATVKLFPTATFPLASLTMLVVDEEGCMTFMVLRVDN